MREQPTANGTARRVGPFFYSAKLASAAALSAVAVALAACEPAVEQRAPVTAPPAVSAPAPSKAPPKAAETAAGRLVLVTASGRHTITIELADNDRKRTVGLMFRTSLPDNHGMLFPYPGEQELTMWMSNTYIPLDMVFIRADGVVHRIAYDTEPMSEAIISSQGPVSAVLELRAGEAKRLRIEPGSRVEHPHFKPAASR